jgi:predicted AAA+ superfamily ATPase
MMYERYLKAKIEARINSGKAIVLLGPRQVGKTTLIKDILQQRDYIFFDGDDPRTRALLNQPNTEEIRRLIGKHRFVFIDEAQRIAGIGLTMKIITDQFKDVQVISSGSSSFDLAKELNEPLTGRKWEYNLYPISWEEYENAHGYLSSEQQLENRLLFGLYPDVLNNPGDEVPVLRNLLNSYLYRDILAQSDLRRPEILDRLVQALAWQVGNEVNYTELAQLLTVDKNTVARYIEILEKGYVIFRLGSFSRNLRNEIKTNRKVYFFDNGIRNMIIGNFDPLQARPDKGALWENFLIAERVKQIAYKQLLARSYFWRTKQQQEVDYVEDVGGKIFGYEFKWSETKSKKLPITFTNTYQSVDQVITRQNFRDFVVA